MRKSAREVHGNKRRKKAEPQTIVGSSNDVIETLLKMMCHDEAANRTQSAPELRPTQRAFIYDDAPRTAYCGPAGCAKTTTIVAKELIRCLLHPGHKSLLSRLHYNDLLATTARRCDEMINRLPPGILADRQKLAPMVYWIQPIIEGPLSEIWFMGLDDGLGSFDWNSAALDESDEMEEFRVNEVTTRLRSPGGHHSLSLSFNPPAKTHWLYMACTGKDHNDRVVKANPDFKLYMPQARENALALPENYYENMVGSEEQLMRLRDGKWGETFPGDPVYPQYVDSMHGKDNLIQRFDPQVPLLRFWDFGYGHPCCIWAQQTFEGQLLHLKCIVPTNIEIEPFADMVIGVTNSYFPKAQRIVDSGDPAVNQKKDTGHTLGKLIRKGITMMYKPGISIARGLAVMRNRLSLMIEGEAAMQYDRKECAVLISALKGGYRLSRDGITPFKDGFYDHPADTDRYGVFGLYGDGALTTAIPQSVAYSAADDNYVTSPSGNILIPSSLMPEAQ